MRGRGAAGNRLRPNDHTAVSNAAASCFAASLSLNLDFVLMHEFKGAKGDFLDWHIDTKPGDRTGQTVNINVMLSKAGEDYTGGGILVGH